MTPQEYIQLAIRTESTVDAQINRRLDHAADGLCTESGEVKDIMKRSKFYGKNIDIVNYKEELGDILWYIAIACDALDCTFEELMEKNIEKLRIRYPEKFTHDNALNRDLIAERKSLEG